MASTLPRTSSHPILLSFSSVASSILLKGSKSFLLSRVSAFLALSVKAEYSSRERLILAETMLSLLDKHLISARARDSAALAASSSFFAATHLISITLSPDLRFDRSTDSSKIISALIKQLIKGVSLKILQVSQHASWQNQQDLSPHVLLEELNSAHQTLRAELIRIQELLLAT
ncbi:hypothetical protein Cgig2_003702 [Carnegiea gigantea]|uniref:Uncharacterized protein n=1 Tax=Carnegiea gigantea TaxID=171969 RepID=A0A9Q1KFY8_9CARY|nr:hypothetical protein Cgig2_003702 [Carnegiea gigantea]